MQPNDYKILPEALHHKTILFCVLDWGLGHATRSSVLIKQLLRQNNQITLLSAGSAIIYLKKEFKDLEALEIKPLDLKYYNILPAWLSIGLQFSTLKRRLKIEHAFVNELVNQKSFDFILSDSCYGAYHKSVPSVLISHQLQIQTKFFSRLINPYYSNYFKPFQAIWVPDFGHHENLSGALAHGDFAKHLGGKTVYINPLNRFEGVQASEKSITFLFILSGPEPMRSQFEAEVFQFAYTIKAPTVIVRGSTISSESKNKQTNLFLKVYDLLDEVELGLLLSKSKIVVCRSGYSSIMDYWRFSAIKYILASPGQTEQIYLAEYLNQRYGFKSIKSLAEIDVDLEEQLIRK